MSESGAMLSKRLKGMKIRQEFICPITHDLLRDPVVLADGIIMLELLYLINSIYFVLIFNLLQVIPTSVQL